MSDQNKNIGINGLIEQSLKSEPGYLLPDNFADRAAAKFERHLAFRNYLHEFVIYFVAGVGLIGIAAAMFFFLMSDVWMKLFVWASTNLTELIGLALVLVFILFADRVLLRYFYLKTKHLHL